MKGFIIETPAFNPQKVEADLVSFIDGGGVVFYQLVPCVDGKQMERVFVDAYGPGHWMRVYPYSASRYALETGQPMPSGDKELN